MTTKTRAAIEDLYRVPDHQKAELVDGEIALIPLAGARPGRAAGAICIHLLQHERQNSGGFAFPGSVGFVVRHLPHRESFCADASWHTGLPPENEWKQMKFVEGAPAFAAEVRNREDYGPAAERDMAAKRADYFAAGTLVVWDADLLSPDAIKKYTSSDPDVPIIFQRGDIADAEPAVPGWTMPVDALFT